MTDWRLPEVEPIDWEEEIAACMAKCGIFPAHYSDTAIAVLSLPGWTDNFNDSPDWGDDWRHENGTQANVDTDGTISTYPTVTYDDGMTDYWSPNSPHYADDYMTADPIFQD